LLNIDTKLVILILSITTGLSIIYTSLQYIFKFYPERKISRFFFILFTFIKTIIAIFIIVIAIYFIYSFYNTINQYLNLLELKKYVKNLSRERVLAKITITDIKDNIFKCDVELYTLTGKIFKKSSFEISGKEFYMDFVVLNFDYAFIEKGANNIAYPSVIFSDEISYDNATPLLNNMEIKEYLNTDSENFIGLTPKKVESLAEFIYKSIKENNFARINGVRSIIGSALHHKVFLGAVYKVYLQNTGGIILVEENF